ncbi:MAG: DMT family transporter [Gemmatimonadales bacterium]
MPAAPPVPPHLPTPATGTSRLAGYLCALGAGATWGTTGPLSTALYAEGAALTGIGFWRILLGTLALAAYGLSRPDLFRIDRRGLLLVGLGGGALVALFEVAYQFAIAGAGVAGAAALLYTAPVLVAILARLLLGETLTPLRLALAALVMVGAIVTVKGGSNTGAEAVRAGLLAGVVGGALSALSYALTTLMARFAVPRYGVVKVLFYEALGGTVLLGVILPLAGHPPAPAETLGGWIYLGLLTIGSVLAANFFFFAAVRRIEAAPAAVAATIEPVVGTLLALVLFSQGLTGLGWLGLAMVVGGVAAGYWREARAERASG